MRLIKITGFLALLLLVACPGKPGDDNGDIDQQIDTADVPPVPDSVISDIEGDEVDIENSDEQLVDGPDPDLEKPDPGVGRDDAADFTLSDVSGKSHSLSKYKGKVVLVDFWATWCGPCKAEIPHLADLYIKYKGQGFVILGVGLDKKASIERYLATTNVPYIVLVDEDSKSSKSYGVSGIPRTIMVDKKGRVAFDHTGYTEGMEDELDEEIATLLGEEY